MIFCPILTPTPALEVWKLIWAGLKALEGEEFAKTGSGRRPLLEEGALRKSDNVTDVRRGFPSPDFILLIPKEVEDELEGEIEDRESEDDEGEVDREDAEDGDRE
jgi:hypothetical protein